MSATDGGESEKSKARRQLVITFFPMFIAVLSLLTSVYNGYLNNKFVVMIQGGLSRSEYMRTCRDAIDAYFQVKYRAGVVSRAATGDPNAAAPGSRDMIEAGNAVAKFGALATYLANLRDEDVRVKYTHLYWKLEKFAALAGDANAKAERDKLIGEADAIFYELNNDCVATAKRQN